MVQFLRMIPPVRSSISTCLQIIFFDISYSRHVFPITATLWSNLRLVHSVVDGVSSTVFEISRLVGVGFVDHRLQVPFEDKLIGIAAFYVLILCVNAASRHMSDEFGEIEVRW
jgi:hypothetical protein